MYGLLEAIEIEKGKILMVERNNMSVSSFINADLAEYAKDGRLTEPSDGKIFDYRKMLELVKQLGRPLTEKEAEDFRIKDEEDI